MNIIIVFHCCPAYVEIMRADIMLVGMVRQDVEDTMLEIATRMLDKDITVLEVSGAIDGSSAPQLREAIVDTTRPGCKLLMDMQRVHFMSSAGLRVMLLLHRQLQQGESQVVLVGMLEPIYDAMEATGFLKYFDTAPDIDSGVRMLE